MTTAIIYSSRHKGHHNSAHPENRERLDVILDKIRQSKLRLIEVEARKAKPEQVALVHDKGYVKFISGLRAAKPGETYRFMTADNYSTAKTYSAALYAVGGVLTGIDLLFQKKADNAFALVRPPGHHAETSRAMGFCFFNNIAIGARYAQKKWGAKRVFIFDFDVHHGNGTQHIFESDNTIYYCSIHHFPHYPGTGRRDEAGLGKGKGFTLNFPLEAGAANKDYLGILKKKVIPQIRQFKPDLILVSAGFDCHKQDPLGGMELDEKGFVLMARQLKAIAAEVCAGRLLFVLEGGYHLQSLANSVVEVLKELSA